MGILHHKQKCLPFATGSDTSEEAASSVVGSVDSQRAAVFAFIQRAGEHGATCDEVEMGLRLSHQAASARVWELAGRNRTSALEAVIWENGQKRQTRTGRRACVYVTREYMP